MDYIECCKRYDSAMKLSDSMGLNYLTNVDIDVCNYVYKQLSYIDFSRFSSGKPISLEKLIDDSVKEISLFGEDISSLVLDIVNNTLINSKVRGDITQFSTCISYDKENGEVIPRGSVYSYNIPDSLYEYSVYIFSHEHLHALKETRYLEWKDSNIIGEVIPLFYELVISSEEDILKKQLLTARLNDLFYNGCEFELTNDLIKTEKENNLYLYVRTIIGRYLNGFYYAVILYNMYKENPVKILGMISKVLKQEITTLELLNSLNIYGDIKGEVFEKELVNFRKRIK